MPFGHTISVKERLKLRIKQAVQRWMPPFYRNYSYAQCGEDVILDFLFQEVGLDRPSYLEIGVYKPIEGSNTYKFYDRGSQGVLVEADQSLIPWIQYSRPRDRILNQGVTTDATKTVADFFIFDAPGINTFCPEAAQERQRSGQFELKKVVSVPLKTINQIIADEFERTPDLLSLDIEGLDFDVIQSLDLERFPVPVICVETCTYSEDHIRPKDERIQKYLVEKNYRIYADTYVNTIFVRNDWFLSFRKSTPTWTSAAASPSH